VIFTDQYSASRTYATLAILGLLALLCIALACCLGSVSLSLAELLTALSELVRGEPSSMSATLFELRLHRALAGFVTGGTLALAGVLMQALLRNPLAEPYVLGVSGGAAVGALLAMLLCSVAWIIDVAAFAGAALVASLLFMLAYNDFKGSGSSQGTVTTLLLTGVIVGSGCMAIISLILSISPDGQLRSMVFWLIGDLSGAELRYVPWVIMLTVLAYCMKLARVINVAALYSDGASTLGISVGRLRKILFFCAALLTASAVSNAGSIGFVGLVMPHACRFAWGPDHRLLIPASCIAGGSFVVLADALARTIAAPQQLPVGVITALIGVPLFLVQLHQQRRHYLP